MENVYSCRWCRQEFISSPEEIANFIVSDGSCPVCSDSIFRINHIKMIREVIEGINEPVLVMQEEPRLVLTANSKAGNFFGKDVSQMDGCRGGQIFDCIQSFTEAGCGKDINCDNCRIKQTIMDTLNTGNSYKGLKSPLEIKRNGKPIRYVLQISTEKIGELALVRIDDYRPE